MKLECGPMPNVMAALSNIGGALCSTPQSFADAQYYSATGGHRQCYRKIGHICLPISAPPTALLTVVVLTTRS